MRRCGIAALLVTLLCGSAQAQDLGLQADDLRLRALDWGARALNLVTELDFELSMDRAWLQSGTLQGACAPAADPLAIHHAHCRDVAGLRLLGRATFRRYIGIEVGYADLTDVLDMDALALGAEPVGLQQPAGLRNGHSLRMAAMGRYPLASFEFFGKAGLHFWDVYTRNDIKSPIGDEDGADLMLGLGAQYNINDRFGVRAQWEHFEFGASFEQSVDLFSGGVIYRF